MESDLGSAGTRPVRLDGAADLDDFVREYDLALVEFYTEGCTLCQAMEPVLGNVARATDAAVALINPRTGLSLVDRFDVRSVPLLVLFVDGDPVARLADGFVGAEEVVSFVDGNAA